MGYAGKGLPITHHSLNRNPALSFRSLHGARTTENKHDTQNSTSASTSSPVLFSNISTVNCTLSLAILAKISTFWKARCKLNRYHHHQTSSTHKPLLPSHSLPFSALLSSKHSRQAWTILLVTAPSTPSLSILPPITQQQHMLPIPPQHPHHPLQIPLRHHRPSSLAKINTRSSAPTIVPQNLQFLDIMLIEPS